MNSKYLKNILIIITTSLLLFSFVLACGGQEGSQDISSKLSEEEPEEIPERGSKENPFTKNEIITVEEVEWQLLEAESLGNTLEDPNGFLENKVTSGAFIKIRFKVKNIGSEMKTLTSLYLIDDQDREYTSYAESFGYLDVDEHLFLLDNINPGISKTYVDIYEVPKDAKGLILEITSLEFARSKAYIDLAIK
jgi:hypothetical protein